MQYKNKLFIDGKWLDGEGGATFDVINPASEEVITKVASAGIEDAKKAINAAEIAFESWAKVSPRDKSVILRKAYELFMDKIEHFAELITLENGKAYGDAKGEALYSAEFLGGILKKLSGELDKYHMHQQLELGLLFNISQLEYRSW